MHGGFEVWLLNRCGPNLCFPKAFSKVLDFHGENLATYHLSFAAEIRHYFVLGDMDYDNHIRKRVSRYIYTHTSCTMLAHRARK